MKYCGLVAAISQVREPWLSHAWLTFRKKEKKIATVYIGLQNEGKDWCSKAYYLLLLGTLGLATIISKFVCSIIIKVENKVHSRAEPFLIMMIKFAHYFAKAVLRLWLPLYFAFLLLGTQFFSTFFGKWRHHWVPTDHAHRENVLVVVQGTPPTPPRVPRWMYSKEATISDTFSITLMRKNQYCFLIPEKYSVFMGFSA